MGKSITLRIVTNTDNAVKKAVMESVMKAFTDNLSLPRIAMSVLREEQIRYGIAVEEQNISREKMEGLVHKSGISIDFKQFTEKGRQTVSAMQYFRWGSCC
ncbi:MAG: hypothetical protein VR69_05410 [Peptococcaceae bacterium BRH_c4b]|nr:MAG: hypothetical protein VR69_05410 [Peptococcaceae bacterium BRH_c4b]